MPLPTQLLSIPFRAGLDEKTQDQVLEPGQAFVTVENRVQSKAGGFDKRPGYRKTSSVRQDGTNRTVGQSVFALGAQTCVYDGSRLDVYAEGAGAWFSAGKLRNIALEALTANTTSASSELGLYADRYDMATVGGYLILSHTVGTGSDYTLVISVLDKATGTNVLEKTFAANTIPPQCRLATIGPKVLAFYTDNTNPADIYVIDLNTGALGSPGAAWSAPYTATTTWDGEAYDVSSLRDFGAANTAVMLAWSNVTITTQRFTGAAAPTHTTTHITGGATAHLACGGTTDNVAYIAWSIVGNTTDVFVMPLSPATLIQSGNDGAAASYPGGLSPFRIGITASGTNQFYVVAHQKDSTTPAPTIMFWAQANLAFLGPVPVFQGETSACMAITRPFFYADTWTVHAGYVALQNDGNSQRMEYLLDITTATVLPMATVNARLSSWANPGITNAISGVAGMHVADDGTDVYLASYQLLNASARSTAIVKVSHDGPVSPVAITSNDGAHMPGAIPAVFDGREVIEDGFLYAPAAIGAIDGAGSIPAGSYAYVAIFERLDSRGNVWWSGPSVPVVVTVPAGPNKAIRVDVQGYKLSMANDSAYQSTQVVLYRTKASGTVYYRVSAKGAFPNVVTFTDNATDASIEDNAVLYIQPGTLGTSQPRQCPPSFTCETVHMDRVFGASGKNVWYSAVTVDGEGTWFSDAFQFPVERGGNITGLCSQDGRLYVFKPDSIYYVDGQGPPENGGNGTEFSSPIELPTTVGCIDARSIVRTQAGIFFQSSRGIELLTRKQEVTWIGEGVDDHLTTYPVVTSAALDETTSRVTFTLATDETATDCAMIQYDFTVNMWSTLTVSTDVADGQAGSAIVPTTDGQKFAFLAPDGTLFIERSGSGLDQTGAPPDTFVTSTIETPWIKMAGLGGYQRTRRVQVQGERLDPHDLIISVAYDFSPTYTQTRRWTWTELVSFAAEDVEIHLKTQKCQALRIKIEDAPPTGGTAVTGQGCTLFGLTIEWGAKQGTNKLPARQRS